MAILHRNKQASTVRPPSVLDRAVLEYMHSTKKEYYDEEISKDSRFEVWYQLSVIRTGLLSWYEFKKEAKILEIGAGFGALTGLLCDRGSYVAVTERSAVRAEALNQRWEHKDNLHVYAGEWSEIDFGVRFDYIIITGILERACNGSKNRQDYVDYLKKVFRLLKEDGILLLSVDNRLGLKYFCGARESHGGNAFEGINSYPHGTRGYSFDRAELQDIVRHAGFDEIQFYYPLPDYKLPQLIYTDSYLPEQNLKERLIPYYENHNSLVAIEEELYQNVIENKVFPFFANSFLVECSRNSGGKSIQKQSNLDDSMSQIIYAAISTDRGEERAYATTIRKDGTVKKIPLFPQGKENARKLFDNIEDLRAHQIPVVKHELLSDGSLLQPFISWPTLSNYIKDIIKQNTEEFIQLIHQIYNCLL